MGRCSPRPPPGPDDVLIQVKACALNHLDIWVRMGIPGITVPLPHILGADVAGIIDFGGRQCRDLETRPKSSGGPRNFLRHLPPLPQEDNDHLCDKYDILGQQSNGGYAEYVKVPAANVLPFPDPSDI
jgi:NADPH:quinone reductase-like Zn-dependent oxidoreductase